MKFSKTSILFLLLLTLLVGCGNQETIKTESENEPIDITIFGGSPTGVWFMISNGISECINSSYPGSVSMITPGNDVSNVIRIGNNEADVGMMNDYIVLSAEKGYEPFEEKVDNLVSIAGFYSSKFQMVVNKDLGFTTFDEIIDNKIKLRISIGQKGSSPNVIFERIINEYGVTIEDMEAWGAKIYYKNFADTSSMFSDGSIDAYGILTLVPAPPIVECSLNNNLSMLELNPQVIDSLAEKYYYNIDTIAAGSYDFQSEDYSTVSNRAMLCASTDLDDETAYKIARSIVENIESMRNVHSALKDITPEFLSQSFGVKLHPGALKYYKEIGVIE